MKCAVKNCEVDSAVAWNATRDNPNVPTIEYAVCGFHAAALDAGEPYTEEDPAVTPPVLLMGTDLALDVVNVRIDQKMVGTPIVTLELGRDGVPERSVSVRWNRSDLQTLARMFDRLEGRTEDE